MPVSEWLKGILVCPIERSMRLAPADPALLERLNAAIAAGAVSNRGGRPVTEPLEAALVRSDAAIAYPVVHGIPVLVPDDGIDCRGIGR